MQDKDARFNPVAGSYDTEFTLTETGRHQRSRVHDLVYPSLSKGHLSILELNCGTGEDAIWFAKQGHFVVATDISSEMIKTVRAKAVGLGVGKRVQPMVCAIQEIGDEFSELGFDLVFSNFGGLNCLSEEEIRDLGENLATLLGPEGKFIAVIMPRGTLWERIYFLLKGQWKKAFRRNSKAPLSVSLDKGVSQLTWYYTPGEFSRALGNHFELVKKRPVGITVPPSYLDAWSYKKPRFFKRLARWEKPFSKSFLSNWGDHCYLEFQKKK